MTTPTTMTTSMITTATTMMTDVVVAPSLEGLLVGCMLLIETVPVVTIVPTVWGGEVTTDVGEVMTDVGEVVPTVCVGEVMTDVGEVMTDVGEVVPTVCVGEVMADAIYFGVGCMLLPAAVNTPSHWALVVGCMLLLTETSLVSSSVLVGSMVLLTETSLVSSSVLVGSIVLLAWTVPFVVIVPTFEEGVVLAEVGAVER